MVRRLSAALLALLVTACAPEPKAYDLEAVKAAGNPMVTALMRYRSAHGQYPASLREAGIPNATTELGDFEYARKGSGKRAYFVLAAGDYARNGFVIFWNSEMEPPGWVIEE